MSARPNMAQASHKAGRTREDITWMRHASCHGMPDHMFFPLPHAKITPETRRVCGGCPVQQRCLDFALNHEDLQGVWGGSTASERRKLRRTTATETVQCGTQRGYETHLRNGENPCDACRELHRLRIANQRRKRKQTAS